MNCYYCNLMFNARRKKYIYECRYAACEQCLKDKHKNTQFCFIQSHKNCKLINIRQQSNELTNTLDKKVKIVFLGDRSVGKTTLINSMLGLKLDNNNLFKQKHTQSNNVFSLIRNVQKLKFQYNLWDTAIQSSILFEQGYNQSLKNCNIQIIIYKDGEGINKVKCLYDFIVERSQNIFIIIVENVTKESKQDDINGLSQIMEERKYRYLRINCESIEQVNQLWILLDKLSINLKQHQSRLRGNIQRLDISGFKQPQRKICKC